MISISGSLRLHAGPTPPEELDPLEPELPLEPLDPELPLDPLELELLLELELEVLLELEVDPVSAFAPLSASTVLLLVDGGSFAPSGSGSAALFSTTASPSPSSGEVAHAMRATSDRAAAVVRAKRLMRVR